MEKLIRRLTVIGVAAQPGQSVLVHTEQSDPPNGTWGGYAFVVREEDQPRIGEKLKITIENDDS